MGKTYDADRAVAQGEAALADLARHPLDRELHRDQIRAATSSPTIRRRRWWRGWRDVFVKTDGDLKALAVALVDPTRPGRRR